MSLLRKSLIVVGAVALGFGCSSSSTSTPDDAGGGTDAPAPPKDSGAKDAQGSSGGEGGAADSGTCSPNLPAGFTSTWKPPAAHQNACTQGMIDAIIAGCYADTATQATCQSATSSTAAKACGKCIETSSTAAAWGPIVLTSQTSGFYNFGGCVAMADGDGSATGCGAKVRTAFDCTSQSCSSCDPNNTSAFDACAKATESGVCKSQWDATTCVDAEAEGGKPAVGACFGGTTGADFLAVAVPMFCLETGDGGADGGADASDAAAD